MNLLLRQTCPLLLRSSLVRITATSIYQPKHTKNTSPFPSSKEIWNRIPKQIHPYIRLSRLDKPAGSWLLFLPGAWSIAFAGTSLHNVELIALFALGTVLMRGAGCTINDLWDRDFDRRVERTKSRPIASGRDHPEASGSLGCCTAIAEFSHPHTTANTRHRPRCDVLDPGRNLSSDETVHLLATVLPRPDIQLVGDDWSVSKETYAFI